MYEYGPYKFKYRICTLALKTDHTIQCFRYTVLELVDIFKAYISRLNENVHSLDE